MNKYIRNSLLQLAVGLVFYLVAIFYDPVYANDRTLMHYLKWFGICVIVVASFDLIELLLVQYLRKLLSLDE